MTYSCSDFYDDVMRCLAESGAIPDGCIPENDVGAASDLAIAAIVTMHRASLSSNFVRELLGCPQETDFFVRQASRRGLSECR